MTACSSSDSLPPQQSLTTLHLPPKERLTFWRDTVRDAVVPLEFELVEHQSLDASLAWWAIGSLRLSYIQVSPHRALRQPSASGTSGRDTIVMDFIIDGHCYAEQDGRRTRVTPGSGVICNAARPYSLHFPAPSQLAVLTFPRELLSRQVAALDRGTAIDLARNSQLFPLLNAYVQQLISQAPALTLAASRIVERNLGDLICGTVGENLSHAPLPLSEHKVATLISVRNFIDAHLREPSLTPTDVARALRLSTRYLNQILHAEQTSLGRLILQRRLDAVASALCDPSMASRNISTLALSFGFNDLSHFSKAFRQYKGISPRDYRAMQPDND